MRKRSLGRALIGALLTSIYTAVLAAQPTASLAATAPPGTLDTTFAGFTDDGIVFENGLQNISSIAIQPDGNIVVAGSTGTKDQFGVFRYLPAGQLDPSFDGDGKVIFSDLFTARTVALQRDGAIVVGGTRGERFSMARLTPRGALDTSFDGDGFFVETTTELSILQDMVVQSDGKIVACGWAKVNNGYDFGIARYTANGWRDTSFDGDGKVTIPFGANDGCNGVVQQSDGKLVLAGSRQTDNPFGDNDFAVARLLSNGTLDGSFDGDGKLTTGFGGDESAADVALQPDGKIVVLGFDVSPDASFIARYLPNGALDPTLDSDGKRSIPVDRLSALALQPDGKLLALGFHESPDGDQKFALHRLLANGAPDATFDFDGIAWLDFGGRDRGAALALQPDGRILVGGTKRTAGVLARLWPDGTTFDTGGQQTHAMVAGSAYLPGSNESANALAVQNDGKLLVAGELRNRAGTRSDATLTRFFPDGQIDPSFGARGTSYAFSGTFNAGRAIAIQPDGMIVIAGYTAGGGMSDDFLVARFTPAGTIDFTFGSNGAYRVDFAGGPDRGTALALAPDGEIVVAGSAWNGSRYMWGVARLLSNGTPDSSFDGDGKLLVDAGPASGANAVVVQPDKRILVGGNSGGNDFAVARLLENGALDATFGEYKNGFTITDMGGNDGITALALASNGWIYAAGYSYQGGIDDFALNQYRPNGVLASCPVGQTCGNWPEGKSFINMGGSDQPYAIALRGDNQLVVAGCSDRHMAAVQLSTTDLAQPAIRFQTDFVGYFDCAYGVQFSGTSKNKIVLVGQQSYGSDSNIALARFQTTALESGSTGLALVDKQTTQETAVPTPPLGPTNEQTTQETLVPAPSPTPPLMHTSSQVGLPDMPQ
jgi:uncharacterized delta-60 repeat protein